MFDMTGGAVKKKNPYIFTVQLQVNRKLNQHGHSASKLTHNSTL